MTYITKYLAKYEDLKKELDTNPENIKYYIKYEGFVGSSDSMEYIEQKIIEFKNKQNESTKNK
jgi:hypothetical protein